MDLAALLVAIVALGISTYLGFKTKSQGGRITEIENARHKRELADQESERLRSLSADLKVEYHENRVTRKFGGTRTMEVTDYLWRVENSGEAPAKEVKVTISHTQDPAYPFALLADGTNDYFTIPGISPGDEATYTVNRINEDLFPVQVKVSWQDARGSERQEVTQEVFRPKRSGF